MGDLVTTSGSIGGGAIAANFAAYPMSICVLNRRLLTFHPDGRITVEDEANPSEAAKAVLDALSHEFEDFIRRIEQGAKAKAADEIERLRARVAELEATVRELTGV